MFSVSRSLFVLSLIVFVVWMSLSLAAQEDGLESVTVEQTLHWMSDGADVEDSSVSLTRMPTGISFAVTTSGLEPNDAYTVWWVIFNHPENCSDACGADDIFLFDDEGNQMMGDDGSALPNQEGRDAAGISFARADGHVIDMDGAALFRGHLPVNDTTEVTWGPALLDPMKAEIHITLRTHGQALPGQIDEQIYTLSGGCNPACVNMQTSVFLPVE